MGSAADRPAPPARRRPGVDRFVRAAAVRQLLRTIHAPTLGSTLGIGFVLIASMLFFSVLQSRPVLHEVLITVLMVVTTPITLMLLARAALYRDRTEGNDDVPPSA